MKAGDRSVSTSAMNHRGIQHRLGGASVPMLSSLAILLQLCLCAGFEQYVAEADNHRNWNDHWPNKLEHVKNSGAPEKQICETAPICPTLDHCLAQYEAIQSQIQQHCRHGTRTIMREIEPKEDMKDCIGNVAVLVCNVLKGRLPEARIAGATVCVRAGIAEVARLCQKSDETWKSFVDLTEAL